MKDSKPNNNHRKKTMVILIVIVICLAGLGYHFLGRGKETTDDAVVDGRIFAVSPRVSGFVTEVRATDNQAVKKGQILFRLDPSEYQVNLAEAEAALAEAEATLVSLELGVPLELTQTEQRVRAARAQSASLEKTMDMAEKEQDAAEQDLKRAQAENELADHDLRRMSKLRKTGAVSQSALDSAEARAKTTRALVRAARAGRDRVSERRASLKSDLKRLQAQIDLAATGEDQAAIRSRQVQAQKARVDLARARITQARLNLEYTTILSPADGFVTRKSVEPGAMVSRGQPVMAVVPIDPGALWITANYKETQLTNVRPGQRVTLKVDAFPDADLTGTVHSIMAGTGAAFSLFPPENASGNFVKIVQRIPVKITIRDNPHPLPPLRIGMSVVPTIHTSE